LIFAMTPNPVGNGGDEYVDEGEFHGVSGVEVKYETEG
jgi:hypothetical protein